MKICRLFFQVFLLIIVLNPLQAQFSGMGGGFEPDSSKKVKIAALPIINYDPSIGFISGALGMGFYRLNQEDTISPPSVTGAGLRYLAIPSEQINVGIDLASGKEDWGIYFNITEAF